MNVKDDTMSEISQECKDSFIVDENMPEHTKDVMRKAWFLYERCRRYSGRCIHEVCGLAGRLLNYAYCLQSWYKADPNGPHNKDVLEEREHCEKMLKENLEDGLKRFGNELP